MSNKVIVDYWRFHKECSREYDADLAWLPVNIYEGDLEERSEKIVRINGKYVKTICYKVNLTDFFYAVDKRHNTKQYIKWLKQASDPSLMTTTVKCVHFPQYITVPIRYLFTSDRCPFESGE